MKKKLYLSALSLACLMLFSCGNKEPQTKEDYMKQYDQFVTQMEQNKNASESDMQKQSAEFDQFSKSYYEKFKDQLSATELAQIASYKLRYAKAATVQKVNQVSGAVQDALDDSNKKIDEANDAVNDKIDEVNKTKENIDQSVQDAKDDVNAVKESAEQVHKDAKQTAKNAKDAFNSLKKK